MIENDRIRHHLAGLRQGGRGPIDFSSPLAFTGANVVPFPAVNHFAIPWDFALILIILGIVVPWRGLVRVRQLTAIPDLGTSARLSLYGSTIGFQWLLAAVVAWRAHAENLSAADMGLVFSDFGRTAIWTAGLTTLLCANQFVSITMLARMAPSDRGPLIKITERLMPRTSVETCVFAALAVTAGISEEFVYRGFAFAVFARLFDQFHYHSHLIWAVVASSLLFAIGHLYQGRRGVLTTFVVGSIFCLSRILASNLIPSVVAHSAVDLTAGIYLSYALRKTRTDVSSLPA